jgi:predicted homoserine dehydrogenase-like protein
MIHRTLICVAAVFAAVSSFHVSAFKSAVGPLKGTSSAASRSTTLFAEKKAATKKKSATDDDAGIEKFKKADFVSAVAEKTGMTKVQSELAMTAVLDVLATVSIIKLLFVQFNQDCVLFSNFSFYMHTHIMSYFALIRR